MPLLLQLYYNTDISQPIFCLFRLHSFSTMHYLKFLAALTALCVSSTSATCFSSGVWWGSENDAKEKLANACHELDGNYDAGEVYSVCRNSYTGGGQKYIFEVRNQNGYAVSLSHSTCVGNLRRQIDNCARGGYEVFGGVRMKCV